MKRSAWFGIHRSFSSGSRARRAAAKTNSARPCMWLSPPKAKTSPDWSTGLSGGWWTLPKQLYVCLCVYVYAYAYIYNMISYACMYMYLYVFIYLYIYIYIYIYSYIYYLYLFLYLYLCLYLYLYIYIMYIYIYPPTPAISRGSASEERQTVHGTATLFSGCQKTSPKSILDCFWTIAWRFLTMFCCAREGKTSY